MMAKKAQKKERWINLRDRDRESRETALIPHNGHFQTRRSEQLNNLILLWARGETRQEGKLGTRFSDLENKTFLLLVLDLCLCVHLSLGGSFSISTVVDRKQRWFKAFLYFQESFPPKWDGAFSVVNGSVCSSLRLAECKSCYSVAAVDVNIGQRRQRSGSGMEERTFCGSMEPSAGGQTKGKCQQLLQLFAGFITRHTTSNRKWELMSGAYNLSKSLTYRLIYVGVRCLLEFVGWSLWDCA